MLKKIYKHLLKILFLLIYGKITVQKTNKQNNIKILKITKLKSKTFGKYFMIELSEKNSKSIFIPAGFAHGFLCLDKENYVVYSCTNYRHEKSEVGIVWNDPDLKI